MASGETRIEQQRAVGRSRGDLASEPSLSGSMKNSCSKLDGYIRSRPATSIVVGLAAGLGVGVALGYLIAGQHQSQQRHWFSREAADRLSHQVLGAMGRVVPDAVKRS